MTTLTQQQVLSTTLPFNEALVKLQARVQTFPPVSLLTKREVSFPEAVVHVTPEGYFSVSQRKSYFNPWAPSFKGALRQDDEAGTVVEGSFSIYPALRHWITLYRLALAGGLLANGVSAHTLYCYALPHAWVIGQFLLIVWLTALMGYLVKIKNHCERHYKELASGEETFILSFLENTLQIHRSQVVTSEPGTPADELSNAA